VTARRSLALDGEVRVTSPVGAFVIRGEPGGLVFQHPVPEGRLGLHHFTSTWRAHTPAWLFVLTDRLLRASGLTIRVCVGSAEVARIGARARPNLLGRLARLPRVEIRWRVFLGPPKD